MTICLKAASEFTSVVVVQLVELFCGQRPVELGIKWILDVANVSGNFFGLLLSDDVRR